MYLFIWTRQDKWLLHQINESCITCTFTWVPFIYHYTWIQQILSDISKWYLPHDNMYLIYKSRKIVKYTIFLKTMGTIPKIYLYTCAETTSSTCGHWGGHRSYTTLHFLWLWGMWVVTCSGTFSNINAYLLYVLHGKC